MRETPVIALRNDTTVYKGERFNSISHVIGAAASLAGLAVLVVYAAAQGDPWKIVSFSVYGVSLFSLYLSSALYHSFRGRPKAIFRKFDHAAIYLLIAGTYTPFTLVTLRGGWGWSLFGVIWGLAVAGILLDIPVKQGNRILPVVIYILMGWLCLIAVKPLFLALSLPGFLWLATGGVLYTGGIVFYALDNRHAFFHGIWHIFVLAGSACHFWAVLFYVL